eukprot:TRINITY_DN25071_c1_g1_i1.p3 TRINITY_DN25071_c1_g1~~TRINITY_DN25071_c1_g1_i1.p3  ORF type:complete len:123 (+),score=37.30 TRINITY_DN25071_c1_g1_i1:69-437(+)
MAAAWLSYAWDQAARAVQAPLRVCCYMRQNAGRRRTDNSGNTRAEGRATPMPSPPVDPTARRRRSSAPKASPKKGASPGGTPPAQQTAEELQEEERRQRRRERKERKERERREAAARARVPH